LKGSILRENSCSVKRQLGLFTKKKEKRRGGGVRANYFERRTIRYPIPPQKNPIRPSPRNAAIGFE